MKQKYIFIIMTLIGLFMATSSYSQTQETKIYMDDPIQGLTLYPNPVSNGKLFIYSSKNLLKQVEIFDVLGKKVLSASIFDKTLDVSSLTSGVYIIKVEEGSSTSTRKLVIR